MKLPGLLLWDVLKIRTHRDDRGHPTESAALLKPVFQDALLLMGFAFRQLFQTVSQFCTSLEFDDLLGSDFNLLLSGRIDTCASRTLSYSESTKAQESYLITLFKCVSNGVEGCVERFFSVSLAQFCTCSNGIYEIGFVHEIVVFRNFLLWRHSVFLRWLLGTYPQFSMRRSA